jgi:hypothetical protein
MMNGTYMFTMHPKFVPATWKGCQTFSKVVHFSWVYRDIAGTTSRSICSAFRIERDWPSYWWSKSMYPSVTCMTIEFTKISKVKLTRLNWVGPTPRITFMRPHNIPTLQIPQSGETFNAIEQHFFASRRNGKGNETKSMGRQRSGHLSGSRVPLFDRAICWDWYGCIVWRPCYIPDRVRVGWQLQGRQLAFTKHSTALRQYFVRSLQSRACRKAKLW